MNKKREMVFGSHYSIFESVKINIPNIAPQIENIIERSDFERSIKNAIDTRDTEQLEKILTEYKSQFPDNAVVKELLDTLAFASSKPLASAKSYDMTEVGNYVRGVYANFEVQGGAYNKRVIQIPYPLPYEVCKEISREAVHELKDLGYGDTFPFVVSPNIIIRGRIIEETKGTTRQILMSNNWKLDKNSNPVYNIRFFGERHPITSETYEADMYVYTLQSSEIGGAPSLKEFVILSLEPLPHEEIQITGMEMRVRDRMAVGSNAQVDTTTSTVFTLSHSRILDTIDETQFNTIIQDYNTHDKLFELYYSILRQPPLFEILLLALLFCRKGSQGYPLHFGMFGPASCGKSKILEAISGRFGEQRALESGTIKSLMPNFGGQKADPGHFIKSRRFSTVDEFLDLVLKSTNSTDIEGFNSLLMHATGVSGSGKHTDSLVVKPTAAMVFASNYKPGKINNFIELTEKVNIPFLSRFMIYNYTQEHITFIKEAELELMDRISRESYAQKKDISISDYVGHYDITAIKISDYLKDQMTLIYQRDVYDIFNEVKQIVPDTAKIRELYNARSPKIVEAILDGVIKYHYIIDKREGEMVCEEKDLELAKELWYMVVSSWIENYEELPMRYRVRTLTRFDSHVYEVIKSKPGCLFKDIEKEVKKYPGAAINHLIKLELVKYTEVGATKAYFSYNYIPEDEFE